MWNVICSFASVTFVFPPKVTDGYMIRIGCIGLLVRIVHCVLCVVFVVCSFSQSFIGSDMTRVILALLCC